MSYVKDQNICIDFCKLSTTTNYVYHLVLYKHMSFGQLSRVTRRLSCVTWKTCKFIIVVDLPLYFTNT